MTRPEDVPALGIEIASALGDTRQVKMTTFASRDAPPAEINALLGKLVAAAARQEAGARIEKLVDDIEDGGRSLQNLHDDVTRLDAEHRTNLARIDVQAGYVGEQLARVNGDAAKAGRDKPVGFSAKEAEKHQQALDGLRMEREKLEAERAQHRGNIGVTIARHEQHLAKLREKLAALRAVAEG